MNLSDKIEEMLEELQDSDIPDMSKALIAAEQMADQYSDVEPIPYIVPIERMVGFSIAEKNISKCDKKQRVQNLLPF